MRNSKRIMAIVLTIVLTAASATVAVFADIDYSEWDSQGAYPPDVVSTPLFTPVKTLIDKKIFTGYPDGTFKPENKITRAEVAVALTKMTNFTNQLNTAANAGRFSDLAGYDWAKAYINVMSDAGIIKGIDVLDASGKIVASAFEPGKNISYAELITMLIRTKGGTATELEGHGKWPDVYIQFAEMYNLIGDVVITDWSAPATRGDTAKLMYRNMPKSSTDGDLKLSATSISKAKGTAYLSVSSGVSGVTITYQWYKNSVAMPGETSDTLTIYTPFVSDEYYVVMNIKQAGQTEITKISDICTIIE